MDIVAEFLQKNLIVVSEILTRGNDVCIEQRKNGLVIVEQKNIVHKS